MADAKVCDRCKKLIHPTANAVREGVFRREGSVDGSISFTLAVSVTGSDAGVDGRDTPKPVKPDLCLDCVCQMVMGIPPGKVERYGG